MRSMLKFVRPGRKADHKPLSAILLATSLAIACASGLAAAAPAIWRATSQLHETQPSDCTAITDKSPRLACYDAQSAESQRAPAKGALAPLGTR